MRSYRVYIANTYFYYSLLTVLQVDAWFHRALWPQCKEPTYKIELLTQSIMATFQLPSAVDPAVRMALTRMGGQKKYLHGYSVENSYHMTLSSISDGTYFVNAFPGLREKNTVTQVQLKKLCF